MRTNQKNILFLLVFGIIIYSCKDNKNEKIEAEVVNSVTTDSGNKNSKIIDSLNMVPFFGYKPTLQNFEPVLENQRIKYEHYKPVLPISYFDSTNIYLAIPVTNTKDSIETIENISTEKENTLIVFIKSKDGIKTTDKPITNLLKTEFAIKKTFPELNNLTSHKKLRVVVFYNHIFIEDFHLDQYRTCYMDTDDYSLKKCKLTDPIVFFDKHNFTQEDIEEYKRISQPLEQDGSILGFK
jgi:hypothetical protein